MARPIDRRQFLKTTGQAAAASFLPARAVSLPAAASLPIESGTVSGSQPFRPDGLTVPVGATLRFDPSRTTTLEVGGNVVIEGTLEMRPSHPGVIHTLRFVGIDEEAFIGGGQDVLDSDVGLWVMGRGRLLIEGGEKTAWNRSGDDASWSDTDDLVVTPTTQGDYGSNGFRAFRRGDPVPSVPSPYTSSFVDTAGSVHRDNIEALAAAGITKGCGPGRFCPDEAVTRGQMAALLVRALDLPAASPAGFADTVGHIFEADIDRLAAAGITKGCGPGRFCPNEALTRGQMAALLVRALDLPAASPAGFADTVGHIFEAEIDRLAAAGITKGCNPPQNNRFCPEDPVTRAQLASFLVRALDLPPASGEGAAWRAEVLNLSRSVRIEGTETGRSHIFIHSESKQVIRFAALRYLGPRQEDGKFTSAVSGRYGLHFHHCGSGTSGSSVEGVVIRDCGNHAFVPHLSHGITFSRCISYNTFEDAYWWDVGDPTNNVTFDGCVAAFVRRNSRFFRLTGFFLGNGSDMRVVGCVAVGVNGAKQSSGFHWPEGLKGSWFFQDNVAHNNDRHGIFVWQNNDAVHIVEDFIAYRNGSFGIRHGAYKNGFDYRKGVLFENAEGGLGLHAVSFDEPRLRISDYVVHGPNPIVGFAHPSKVPAGMATEIRRTAVVSTSGTPVLLSSSGTPDWIDFVDSNLGPTDVEFGTEVDAATRVRFFEAGKLIATLTP